MSRRLWFLTDGVKLISVFEKEKDAEKEYLKYEDDPDFAYYEYYAIDIDELDDYPEESDLALDEGFI
jgi:hypothetical protein